MAVSREKCSANNTILPSNITSSDGASGEWGVSTKNATTNDQIFFRLYLYGFWRQLWLLSNRKENRCGLHARGRAGGGSSLAVGQGQ